VGVALYFGMWTGACLVRRLVHFRKNRRKGGVVLPSNLDDQGLVFS
jgi:hypothetical protein